MSTCLHHGVVIPIFGPITEQLHQHVAALLEADFTVILVDNRPVDRRPVSSAEALFPRAHMVSNLNRGLVAGGFNRGVERAIMIGTQVVTLLDQDSRICPGDLRQLAGSLASCPGQSLVGPVVIDQWRTNPQQEDNQAKQSGLQPTRMLISSGTTFRANEWPMLGTMHEPLEIDYVDHYWCYRAIQRGFRIFHDKRVTLYQAFGQRHPNQLCHCIGMQLYEPQRHYTSVRNLRWLALQKCVPADVKAKELLRMVLKPLLWLLFEPRRRANLRAIVLGLVDPLPVADLQQ